VLLLVVLPARASADLLLGMQDAQRTKQLRILAFGDSLTEGWIQSTGEKHPYTWNLQRRLQERLAKRGIGVQVTTEGVGGAGVLDRLGDAWYAQLAAARAAGRPYHYAVMMAGVNDLLRQ
jgi:lysophospholipase L1-like esterase